MAEKEKLVRALELFNEKAEELLSSTFIKTLLEKGNKYDLSTNWETGKEISSFERTGPSKDEIKAFVLDYRFFIQNNESSSFQNMKGFYSSPLLSAKFSSRFDALRTELDEILHSDSPVDYNGKILTYGSIIDTFIFGGLAHANKEKERLVKEWKSMPPFYPLIEHQFIDSLVGVLNVIFSIKELNSEALLELKSI